MSDHAAHFGLVGQFSHHLRLVFKREPWWAEFWSSCASLGWGSIVFFSHTDVVDRVAFEKLGLLADDAFWAGTGLLVGSVQLLALLSARRQCRWGAAFMSCWWWSFLSFAIISMDITPGIALYTVFAAINCFSLIRLARPHE